MKVTGRCSAGAHVHLRVSVPLPEHCRNPWVTYEGGGSQITSQSPHRLFPDGPGKIGESQIRTMIPGLSIVLLGTPGWQLPATLSPARFTRMEKLIKNREFLQLRQFVPVLTSSDENYTHDHKDSDDDDDDNVNQCTGNAAAHPTEYFRD